MSNEPLTAEKICMDCGCGIALASGHEKRHIFASSCITALQGKCAQLERENAEKDALLAEARAFVQQAEHERESHEPLQADDEETFRVWRRFGLTDAWLARCLRGQARVEAATSQSSETKDCPHCDGFLMDGIVRHAPKCPALTKPDETIACHCGKTRAASNTKEVSP
jgi:hypothetical protein